MGTKVSILLALAAFAAAALAPPAGAMKLSRLMAPPAKCGNQDEVNAPIEVQEQTMQCMTNFAREHAGRAGLGGSTELNRSAGDRAGDILRCDSFSHYACGRDFTYWIQRVGYIPAKCWRAGENIAWGTGERGTVRAIFRAWMHSPGHRENIFGRYSQIGIGLRVGGLDGHPSAHVWTQHFGTHCGARPAHPPSPPLAKLADASVVSR